MKLAVHSPAKGFENVMQVSLWMKFLAGRHEWARVNAGERSNSKEGPDNAHTATMMGKWRKQFVCLPGLKNDCQRSRRFQDVLKNFIYGFTDMDTI